MKLSDSTLSVLKNFAAINKSILMHKGNTIRTVSPSKTVMAKAVIDDDIPRDVCIFELPRFLNTVNLFDEPELNFGEKSVTVSSGPSKINYSYANPEFLTVAKNQDLNVGDFFVTVKLTEAVLNAVDKARKTLGLDEISIEGDGTKLYIKALDTSGTTADEYALEIGETSETFKAVFKAENFEMMARDYTVQISRKGITHWKSDNLEYWIVLVANSSKL